MLTKTIGQLKQIHVYGRTTMTEDMLNLFWSGSGLDFLFEGSELSLCYEADYDVMEPWISVLVDGSWILRMPAQKGMHTISLLRGMNPEIQHRIQVLKDVQAMADDPLHRLSVKSLSYEGKILAPPSFDLRIEFIGDSITSGEGCIGALSETDWITAFFTAVPAYGRLTAEALNADYRILSQSGWGIRSAWDNNIYCNLPSCYDYICNLAHDRTRDGKKLGTHEKNDFFSWNADVVVVNLGTNDESSFRNQSFYDPATGQICQNRLLDDGAYHPEDVSKILEAQKKFLKKIRESNPNAAIIWCYGMLGNSFSSYLSAGVKAYCMELEDDRTFYLELPNMTEETVGSRMHPGPACHKIAAKRLTDFIKKLERK